MRFKTDLELKAFLDDQSDRFESFDFISSDPISIPHLFDKKGDIEMAGLLTSLLSWGNRKAIIQKSLELMQRMDMQPYSFIKNCDTSDLKAIMGFVYRTMNENDIINIILVLKFIENEMGGIQHVFSTGSNNQMDGIQAFRDIFDQTIPNSRTLKHIADPKKKSAAKRLNMFLRWMVRSSEKNVDFGLWDTINSSELMIPLDTHSGRVARKLGLLNRKANDAKAVFELTGRLRTLDPKDPIKYDYALFGLGVFDKF